jgi:hypothetical protein
MRKKSVKIPKSVLKKIKWRFPIQAMEIPNPFTNFQFEVNNGRDYYNLLGKSFMRCEWLALTV